MRLMLDRARSVPIAKSRSLLPTSDTATISSPSPLRETYIFNITPRLIPKCTTTIMEKQPLLDEPDQAAEPELSLTELQQNVRQAQQAYWKAWSKTTSGTWHKRIMLIVSTIVTAFFLLCLLAIIDDAWNDDYDYDDGWRYRGKVPLEIHIMSKCPDAQDCLRDMILPAMQNVSDKVDFKMSYIGR